MKIDYFTKELTTAQKQSDIPSMSTRLWLCSMNHTRPEEKLSDDVITLEWQWLAARRGCYWNYTQYLADVVSTFYISDLHRAPLYYLSSPFF